MRSEGFLFLSGGSGAGTVFVPISGLWPRTTANDRERSRTTVLCPTRCALRIRLDGGRLGEALWHRAVAIAGESLVWVAPCRCDCWSGWRRAVVIAGESLVWVAPCRCDCWGESGLGGAVPL